jgi:hypothetical protein
MLCPMNGSPDVSARAIVLQMTHGSGDLGAEPLATYVLTLTVMADDEPPFRCRLSAALPSLDQWNVRVGSHVPVTIDGGRDVRLDVDALRRMYDLG